MPILPESTFLPPVRPDTVPEQSSRLHQSAQFQLLDFDRSLHPVRKHFEAHLTTHFDTEQSLFAAKTRSRFEPDYPKPSRVKTLEVPGVDRVATGVIGASLTVLGSPRRGEGTPRIHGLGFGRRPFPEKFNCESGRSLPAGAQVKEDFFTNVPRERKVFDPATGNLCNRRRGVEVDHLTLHGILILPRYHHNRDEQTVVGHHRAGLGFAKPMDLQFKEVEWSDNFFIDKPGRWYSNPNGRPVQLATPGVSTNQQHTNGAQDGKQRQRPTTSHIRMKYPEGKGWQHQIGRQTQMDANAAALRVAKASQRAATAAASVRQR